MPHPKKEELEWTIHKRTGEWDDVIWGPDTEGVVVVPKASVERLEAALRDAIDNAEMVRQCLVGILRGEIPCPYPPDAEEAHRRTCAVLTVAREALAPHHPPCDLCGGVAGRWNPNVVCPRCSPDNGAELR